MCCVVLPCFVCLTLLASFFLPSHLSCTMHIHACTIHALYTRAARMLFISPTHVHIHVHGRCTYRCTCMSHTHVHTCTCMSHIHVRVHIHVHAPPIHMYSTHTRVYVHIHAPQHVHTCPILASFPGLRWGGGGEAWYVLFAHTATLISRHSENSVLRTDNVFKRHYRLLSRLSLGSLREREYNQQTSVRIRCPASSLLVSGTQVSQHYRECSVPSPE